MKKQFKLFSIFLLAATVLISCENSDITPEVPSDPSEELYNVTINLNYPDGLPTAEGVAVTLSSSLGMILDTLSSAEGVVSFSVPAGIYEATATEQRAEDGYKTLLNGKTNSFTVSESWDETKSVELVFTASTSGQVVIKEFYFGGCQDNTGENSYAFDKYVTLYNNSDIEAVLNNVAVGTSHSNAHAFKDVDESGNPTYSSESWTPLWSSVASTQGEVVIPAYSEVTIALNGAINHTLTYTNSVDLSGADYVIYDPEIYTHASYHPAPSSTIPVENYMKATQVGTSTAFVLGNVCPTVVVFQVPEGIDLSAFGADANNVYMPATTPYAAFNCLKVEKEWVLDAVETFSSSYVVESVKRLTQDLDAGAINFTAKQGYTAYRNVDKTATEAIEGNSDKLVYGYSYGTDGVVDYGTTDASGIDAEASIRNGAVIIYQDLNNSSSDFHQRSEAALKF